MELAFLCDHPDWIPTLAVWHHREWGSVIPNWPLEVCEQELRAHTEREALPTTVIALENGQLVGSASLIAEDLEELSDFSPWLASVYVRADARGRGIGRALVAQIEAIAAGLGVKTLYLFTYNRESLYFELGWKTLEVRPFEQLRLSIMFKRLKPARVGR